MKTYFSHGKLLLTGEYLILDGARGLSVPTILGQEMIVAPNETGHFTWSAFLNNGNLWFDVKFKLNDLEIIRTSDTEKAKLLQQLLVHIKAHKYSLFEEGSTVSTHLQFNHEWGLGSSSTMIGNLSKWGGIDAFELLKHSFGGSGYDVALALEGHALKYRLDHGNPSWEKVRYQPQFLDQLYFIYLNQKKNSREAIANYRNQEISNRHIEEVNQISRDIENATSIVEFSAGIKAHEQFLSHILKIKPVKAIYFNDYPYQMKSLGGWGGDFILAVGDENTPQYFKSKGYQTILPYKQLIKSDE